MGRSPLSFVALYFEFNFVKKNTFEKKLRSEPVKPVTLATKVVQC